MEINSVDMTLIRPVRNEEQVVQQCQDLLGKLSAFMKKKTQLIYCLAETAAAWKVSKYGVFSGPYPPVFGLNTEIYGVNFCSADHIP